jgi:5-methylcytosine-specific restriction protein B
MAQVPPQDGVAAPVGPLYTVESIIADGGFIPPDDLETILGRLRTKKNLILQGPPGTGKTWLAKRLAYVIIGRQDSESVQAIQFHPNISYEDIVCGWRPGLSGTLELVEGPLLKTAHEARRLYLKFGQSAPAVVLVIEEINRGNPAQIFGEMLTLMESTKRRPDAALRLAYMPPGTEPFWLPPNFFLIGTMNVADRSLAIVDLALRRRFSFVDLQPCFNGLWLTYVTEHRAMPRDLALRIQAGLAELNEAIELDEALGPQFRIGHSYFTPGRSETVADWTSWTRQVVDLEIVPLLREYWFDSRERVDEHALRLREVLGTA